MEIIDFQKLILAKKWIYLFDQGILSSNHHFDPFVFTDIFTELAGKEQKIILHFWQLNQTMILGMKDTRVIDLKKGLNSLKKNNYEIVVRNSGGLGVVSDLGTLNLSLILPNLQECKFSIDQAYQFMWDWIKLTFHDFPIEIEAYEIPTSYCPGTYDLSIDGKKIAGIAQRRVKNGIAIMIYLSVNGNQSLRGEMVKTFYQASGEAIANNGYPEVDPSSMSSLEEALHTPFTILEVKNRLKEAILRILPHSIDEEQLQHKIKSDWFKIEQEKQLQRMIQRNQIIE